jgi:hypothetical protein
MTFRRLLPHRWRSRIDAARHARAVAGVVDTPPIIPASDGLVIFSMIGTRVLLPYLVAVKSLWRQLRRGRIAILDDGTLTAADLGLLAHHCGDPEVIRIADVGTGPFPRGGCWERFLTILDRREREYWLQLDSDTVTLGPVPEVASALARNRSFTLLGGPDVEATALPCAVFARRRYPGGPVEGHIQQRIESRLAALPGADALRYIRGCAGFAGFAAGGPGRERAESFFHAMEGMVGREAVATWGTEQVASNFHIANDPDPVFLPHARYRNYWGEPWGAEAVFAHFVGPHRHDRGVYAAQSRAVIGTLLGSGGRPFSPALDKTCEQRA